MTTQADPPSETQQLADARTAIGQSMVRIKELEDWQTKYRSENDKLRAALRSVRRIARHGDVNTQPLLPPILAVIRVALEDETE